MKIAFLSDLHYGNYSSIEGVAPFSMSCHRDFAKSVHNLKPDIIIVAGDFAETCIDETLLSDAMRTYKNPYGLSICIPGNHDLWINHNKSKKYDWRDAYEKFYATAKNNDWIALRDKPFEYNNTCFVGNMGWYDFSTADPTCNMTSEQWDNSSNWSDYEMMRMKSAHDVCAITMKEINNAVSLIDTEKNSKFIAVTHIVGHEHLMADFPRPDFGRAFIGNSNIFSRLNNMDVYYCGHSHRRRIVRQSKTILINNGSGYGLGSKKCDVFSDCSLVDTFCF